MGGELHPPFAVREEARRRVPDRCFGRLAADRGREPRLLAVAGDVQRRPGPQEGIDRARFRRPVPMSRH